ncbi:MAG: dihydrofolate reductase [Pseudomonadota bacterium]
MTEVDDRLAGVGVALIVAAAQNGVIGKSGDIPWRLPSDQRRFKALTMGHTLVMGRLTYQSIGRPLPGRHTIVVTSGSIAGVDTAASVEQALQMAARPVFLAGGTAIYKAGMALADTIYLTRVEAVPDGDAHFPAIDRSVFECTADQAGVRGPRDSEDFRFLTYRRRIEPASI